MVQAWIKTVTADEIVEGNCYFLAVIQGTGLHRSYAFYSTDIKGKRVLSGKPGLATHVIGNDKLRAILRERVDHAAIEIPADAEKRWKRRTRVFKRTS